jgi:hypothetical protein
MNQTEFEALIDSFGDSTKQLVDLVEQARYEQPTALAIANLLDCREQLLALLAKLPALRRATAPDTPASRLAAPQDMPALIDLARAGLQASSDPSAIVVLVRQAEQHFQTIVDPLEGVGRRSAKGKAHRAARHR